MEPQFLRVLVVDDSPTDQILVRAALEESEFVRFEVSSAARLDDTIHRMAAGQFDVVLLDLGLPDSQGLGTLLKLQASATTLPVVIILSGLADEEIAIEAVRRGAHDYLVKNQAHGEMLVRAIRYAVERRHLQDQVEHYAAELRRKNAQLEEEIKMAREVQQALLPQQYPQFFNHSGSNLRSLQFSHCYRPAAELSGDFFSIMPVSDTQAGILICDVMGHGAHAALVGALTHGLIEQFTPVAADPGNFLSGLNHSLTEIFKKARITAFATAFYLVADMAEGRLRYANAGHPAPLVLKRDAGVVEWLPQAGFHDPPLGLLGDHPYPFSEAALSPRESIVLFTDGLYEAENPDEEQYGPDRLMDAVGKRMQLSCPRLFDELVDDIRRFSGHNEFSDDVCLVGMDVVDGVEPVQAW